MDVAQYRHIPRLSTDFPRPPDVIPAKAGTHPSAGAVGDLGPCFRRNDTREGQYSAFPTFSPRENAATLVPACSEEEDQ